MVTFTQSTFSGNTAVYGGAVFNEGGTVMVSQSTVAGNTATNSSASGGLDIFGGTITVRNTLVAHNTAPVSANANCSTGVVHGGGNLMWPAGTGCTGFLAADPVLDGGASPLLKNNGGPTQTIALLAGSAAINAGVIGFCAPPNTVDQRGYARDAQCDIGAFEFGAAPSTGPGDVAVTRLVVSPVPTWTNRDFSLFVEVRNLGPQPVPNTRVTITIPAGVTVTNTQTAVGSCSGTGPVVCQLGTLAPSATATSLRVNLKAATPGTYTFGADLRGVANLNPTNDALTKDVAVTNWP